jgi:nitrile hydratase subunit beta
VRFAPGDRVRVAVGNPPGHNRAPRYLRGHTGVVERQVGSFPLPDIRATGVPDAPLDELYTVRFSSAEVWAGDGHPGDELRADLFAAYLEDA